MDKKTLKGVDAFILWTGILGITVALGMLAFEYRDSIFPSSRSPRPKHGGKTSVDRTGVAVAPAGSENAGLPQVLDVPGERFDVDQTKLPDLPDGVDAPWRNPVVVAATTRLDVLRDKAERLTWLGDDLSSRLRSEVSAALDMTRKAVMVVVERQPRSFLDFFPLDVFYFVPVTGSEAVVADLKHEKYRLIIAQKWMIFADPETPPEEVLKDPSGLIQDLPGEYDLAVRLLVSNHLDGEWSLALVTMLGSEYAEWGLSQFEAIQQAVVDLDHATIGVLIGDEEGRGFVDVLLKPRKDTSLARQIQDLTLPSTTHLPGFATPDSCVSLYTSKAFSEASPLRLFVRLALNVLKVDACEKERPFRYVLVELDEAFGADDVQIAMSLVGDGPFTFVAAMRSCRSDSVASAVEAMLPELADDSLVDELEELDAETRDDIRFRSWNVKFSDETEDTRWLGFFGGPSVKVFVGVRPDPSEVYVAVGSEARKHLERALAESRSVAECPDLAGFRVQLGRLVELARNLSPDEPDLINAAEILRENGEITGRINVAPDGDCRLRIEMDDPVLRLLFGKQAESGSANANAD